MKKLISIACLFAAAALLTGCPKKATTVEPPIAGTQVPGSGSSGEGASATTSPLGEAGSGMGAQGANAKGLLAQHIIYFDFDKSDIKPEFVEIITIHARNLSAHPNLKLRLEGNTDERGTREYNI